MGKLSEKDRDYIFNSERGITAPGREEFYYDNPSAAIEDVYYLVDVINGLVDDKLEEEVNRFKKLI